MEITNIVKGGITGLKNPMINNNSLGSVIRSYKSICTKTIHQINPYFSWQGNYYEHIIRNESELNRIRQYIIDNPKNWEKDRNNKIGLWIFI